MPGVPLLDVLQQTSRLLKNNVDHTDDDDDHDRNEENGDYGDDGGGDLFAPGHQEGSSTSLPSPPHPTPAQRRLCERDQKTSIWEH